MSGSPGLRSPWSVLVAKIVWTEGKGGCLSVLETCELMVVGDDGSRKEKKKENESVLNTVLNTSTVITVRFVRSFSVAPEKIPIYEQFCEIVRREAGSRGFSEVLIKAMEEYNKRHSIGNPQLLITHYVKPEEPQPMRVLCIYCQGALTDGRIFCQKKEMWIPGVSCYSCKNNRLRKQKMKW
jgi:hypothetical protein